MESNVIQEVFSVFESENSPLFISEVVEILENEYTYAHIQTLVETLVIMGVLQHHKKNEYKLTKRGVKL